LSEPRFAKQLTAKILDAYRNTDAIQEYVMQIELSDFALGLLRIMDEAQRN